MPIVFAQPQPLDAAAAFQAGRQQGQLAAGAAAARQQAVLADYFTAAANRDAAHASQNEDRELRASAGNADRAAMLENAGRNRLFQLQENEQQNQQRQAQMRLHADLQNVELSQTEAVRLQRMRQAVGAVNADDSLAPDEKASLIQQLQTGINPLQQRVAAARVKQEEVQTQMMLGQAQKVAALQSATGATRAALFESQVHRRPDGNDYFVDSKGDLKLLEKPDPVKGEKVKPPEPFDWAKELKQAEAEAAVAYPVPAKAEDDANAGKRREYMQRVMDRRQAEHAGQQRAQAQAEPAASPPPANPAVPQPPARQVPQAERRPFNIDDPDSIPPAARPFRDDYMKQVRDVDGLPTHTPPEVKTELKMLATDMAQLVAAAGSPEAMSDAELRAFAAARKKFEQGMTRAMAAKSPDDQARERIGRELATPPAGTPEAQIRNTLRPLLPR